MEGYKNFFVHSLALVESEDIGEGTKIWAFSHVAKGAKIGKYCNIGEHCYIESGVIIGDYCTVKNGICLWDGIVLEDYVFLGPCAVFTNDKYPRSRNKNWELRKTIIRRYASVGAGAVILCGIDIGRYAVIGAGSVVTKSVPDFAVVFGNPAKIRGFACACGRVILKISRKSRAIARRVITCEFCSRVYSFDSGKFSWIGGPPLP
ncbi:dTDP-3-amino-3,6-dideoxy-alpha-D-galactopyranose 3-N-acetyltransferase [bacterium HR19]|nr:dTDP-3-amino-3,6-dideoxy-alpha-D-galactopyranose 3-N-acetyltransferase [bacterium HR19]